MNQLRLLSWNVNSVRVRLEQLIKTAELYDRNVLLLQETKVVDDDFPTEPLRQLGFELQLSGQRTYNGVAVASRFPMSDVETSLPSGFLSEQKRILCATIEGVRIANVYVPNGGSPNLDRFAQKLRFLEELAELARSASGAGPFLMAGDFNVAPSPDDVYDPEGMDGMVCYHPDERQRFATLLSKGLVDLFRRHEPSGKAYSWWDYRGGSFRTDRGMRLDHVLVSPDLEKLSISCRIQREVRGWKRPSDHAPILADFHLP
jgi:exodeoxyribonuclease-3